ncbi:MAG: hypothetical protein ABIA75_01440 [Candidatus Neomarinimicrobiota bacterium]
MTNLLAEINKTSVAPPVIPVAYRSTAGIWIREWPEEMVSAEMCDFRPAETHVLIMGQERIAGSMSCVHCTAILLSNGRVWEYGRGFIKNADIENPGMGPGHPHWGRLTTPPPDMSTVYDHREERNGL